MFGVQPPNSFMLTLYPALCRKARHTIVDGIYNFPMNMKKKVNLIHYHFSNFRYFPLVDTNFVSFSSISNSQRPQITITETINYLTNVTCLPSNTGSPLESGNGQGKSLQTPHSLTLIGSNFLPLVCTILYAKTTTHRNSFSPLTITFMHS